ncbi:hypothetical protein AB0M42_18255 [Streptomyces sp. NPDC051784]|uniref:hypothetical protein n=1 Tax=Streptomyces sp. NPDC051784 TaxID=3155805 RepID=UPI00341EEDCD
MTNTKIGTALVGGYLLGRTKKAKLAIGFGMFLAGKKLSLDPQQLGKLVAQSPVLSGLTDQVRKELLGATKNAASSALTRRVNHLSDSLSERARILNDPLGAARGEEADQYPDEDTHHDEIPDDGTLDSEEDASQPEEPRRGSGAGPAKAAKKTSRAASTAGETARRAGSASRARTSEPASARPRKRSSSGASGGTRSTGTARPARKQREGEDTRD